MPPSGKSGAGAELVARPIGLYGLRSATAGRSVVKDQPPACRRGADRLEIGVYHKGEAVGFKRGIGRVGQRVRPADPTRRGGAGR